MHTAAYSESEFQMMLEESHMISSPDSCSLLLTKYTRHTEGQIMWSRVYTLYRYCQTDSVSTVYFKYYLQMGLHQLTQRDALVQHHTACGTRP